MKKQILTVLFLIVMLSVTLLIASAQDGAEIPACPDGRLEGTVVGVNEETGELIVDVEGSLCVLAQKGDYDHPITSLLGAFFSGFNLEEVQTALEATTICLVDDGEGGWVVEEPAEGVDCSGILAKVIGQEEDGSFLVATEEEKFFLFIEDETLAGELSEALEALALSVEVSEGFMSDTGDEIGAYHDDGYGFGVLVKVYAIASEAQDACLASAEEGEVTAEEDETEEAEESIDPCEVTIEFLIGELENMGMGQLFKLYGKPSILGVGHVRKLSNTSTDVAGDGNGNGNAASGICNARANGGNAHAKGQPDITCDGETTKEKNKNKNKDKDN